MFYIYFPKKRLLAIEPLKIVIFIMKKQLKKKFRKFEMKSNSL